MDTKMKREGEEVVRVPEQGFLAASGEDQEKVSLPQPMGDHGGADVHCAASGEAVPQQFTEGDCSPQTAHGEQLMVAQDTWQEL